MKVITMSSKTFVERNEWGYPIKCPECGSTKMYGAEKVWNKVEDGEIIGICNTEGFTGEWECQKCGLRNY